MDTNIETFAQCVSGIKKNFNKACAIFMLHDETIDKSTIESYERLVAELGKMMARIVLELPEK